MTGTSRPGVLASGLVAVAVLLGGCRPSTWLSRRLIQAPNTFPQVAAPAPRVYFHVPPAPVEALPRFHLDVGPPGARIIYRVVEPARYETTARESRHAARDGPRPLHRFETRHPAPPSRHTGNPRGTVVLLHGYGLSHESIIPWAFLLAGEGWRCIVPDLRGHGHSTGGHIGFGPLESADLQALADSLEARGELKPPLVAFGISYGAAMGLRWHRDDPRVRSVVALTPYASLVDAIDNIRGEYAPWLPSGWIRRAARQIPRTLGLDGETLDPADWILGSREPVFLVASDRDPVSPAADVDRLHRHARPGSRLLVLSDVPHEEVGFRLGDLAGPVLDWLALTADRPD